MEDYKHVYEQYRELAESGMSAEAFYAAVRDDGVSAANAALLLRDCYGMGLKESIAIQKANTEYTNTELQTTQLSRFPDRGEYCPKCRTHIPSFASIRPVVEGKIRSLEDSALQMQEVQRLTGCPEHWAKIWVLHPHGPERQFGHDDAPPCPKCGKQLRTSKAKQCVECGADWH